MVGRTLSILIAVAYLVYAYFSGGGESLLAYAGFLLLPLACIWFPEELGSFTGTMRVQSISTPTPGCFVAFGGWLLLCLPAIVGIILLFTR